VPSGGSTLYMSEAADTLGEISAADWSRLRLSRKLRISGRLRINGWIITIGSVDFMGRFLVAELLLTKIT
jgi:hypothetical protein